MVANTPSTRYYRIVQRTSSLNNLLVNGRKTTLKIRGLLFEVVKFSHENQNFAVPLDWVEETATGPSRKKHINKNDQGELF
jgi:hypothetical protein